MGFDEKEEIDGRTKKGRAMIMNEIVNSRVDSAAVSFAAI
jgi:hypothetical protein